jgi:hypothetical protein
MRERRAMPGASLAFVAATAILLGGCSGPAATPSPTVPRTPAPSVAPSTAPSTAPRSSTVLGSAAPPSAVSSSAVASGTLVLSPNGLTVDDTVNKVDWLADANLAATNRFGLPLCPGLSTQPCVNPSGSMSYEAAVQWVLAMNTDDYLGVSDWQLPATPNDEPHSDTICPRLGPKPDQNRFGFNCTDNALGALFYNGLGLTSPNTAVAIPTNTVGPFSNVQPYLYWAATAGSGGHASFSFASGFKGANTDYNFLYLLPMISGKIAGTPPAVGQGLEVNPGGQTVYDPVTHVTWLANADLAASETFGLPSCTDPVTPALCVDRDGAMTWAAAQQFIKHMNADQGTGYLGQTQWMMPSAAQACSHYECSGNNNPMGELFYGQLGLSEGQPAAVTPNVAVGPFHDIQPYLYWSCEGSTIQSACDSTGAAPGFEWSFSFGDGFLGTDILANDLYVTADHVAPGSGTP